MARPSVRYPGPRERPTTPAPAAPEFFHFARPTALVLLTAASFTEVGRFHAPSDAVLLVADVGAVEFRFLDDTGGITGGAWVAANTSETIRTRAARVEARAAAGALTSGAATALYRH